MSAPSILLVLASLAVLVWLSTRLVVAMRRDGLGTNPPPSSHTDWADASSGLPSHPFSTSR